MWKRTVAAMLSLAVPASVAAGPLKESIGKVARDQAVAQEAQVERGRSRFWTGIALLAGGGTLVILGATEAFDGNEGPDDGAVALETATDVNGDDDSDWANTAMTYGGVAAVAFGGYVLWKGWSSPSAARITVRPGRVVVRHSLRF